MKTFDESIDVALHSSAPLQETRNLAQRLLHEGETKQAILEQFEKTRNQLREKGREAEEDVVCDVMDFLVGWCSPHMKLDEPVTTNGAKNPSCEAKVSG